MTIDGARLRALVDDVSSTLGTATAAYHLSRPFVAGRIKVAIGASRSSNAVLLVLGTEARTNCSLRTKGLHVYELDEARITFEGTELVKQVLVFECLEDGLTDAFCSFAAVLIRELSSSNQSTVETLKSTLQRWEHLFAAQPTVDVPTELGLWGELWALTRSSQPNSTLETWRGPEGGTADFFTAGISLEVKTTTRPGVHHISLTQSALRDGTAFLLSLSAEQSPTGSSCRDLITRFGASAGSPDLLYERLTARQIAGLQSSRTFELTTRPALFAMRDIPRVTAFDAGVSRVRYEILLDFSRALSDVAASTALRPFALDTLFSEGAASCV